MKTFKLISPGLGIAVCLLAISCNDDVPDVMSPSYDLRFDLAFENLQTDLNLVVKDPKGNLYYQGFQNGSEGQVVTYCACGDCPKGAKETIGWTSEQDIPFGVYQYWVEHQGGCDQENILSPYTVQVSKAGVLVQRDTGTLKYNGNHSPVRTFMLEAPEPIPVETAPLLR